MGTDRKKGYNSVDMLRNKYAHLSNEARRRVTAYRKSLGLNQAEFAEHMGLLQNYVSRIEKGEVDFVIEILFSLLDCYGLSPEWIMTGKVINKNSKEAYIPNQDNEIYQNRINGLMEENTKLKGKVEVLKELLKEGDYNKTKQGAAQLRHVSEDMPSYGK